MYGLRIIGASGVAQFDGESKNMFHGGKSILNLPPGYKKDQTASTPWLLQGWEHNITLPSSTLIAAFTSSSWITTTQNKNKVTVRQPAEESAGTAIIHYFNGDSVTATGNYGVNIFGTQGISLADASLLKIIDVFNLSSTTQNWSYNAPAGKRIAVIVGGGNSRFYYRKINGIPGHTLTELYFRTPNNTRVEISFRESWYDRNVNTVRNDENWQRMSLNIIIVDITEL